ncbi:histidine ammonia-lyase [Actinopolyspora lacussalsi subsp. righensis]|uniref:Histidine ammonia-lyase n=1 Tax=Actinopolyspora righensis TaxID=995060 RepID=A0A1I7BAJ9_9ACTN|nr:aromatic amino acid ammonia-lyase [Actinopolyspora righensis]SFT84092.1 histidine ammonia-lyase [Actinopolyspora righensis]
MTQSLVPCQHVGSTTLDGHDVALEDIVRLARDPRAGTVELSEWARQRIAGSDEFKHQLIDTGVPIYGVTSGFGDSNTRQISKRKSGALQHSLVRFLSCGTGPYATHDVIRATMIVRANCLARGWSGVRPELVQLLVDCINERILPRIPERGSVGASGDLVPLAYLAGMLTGESTVWHREESKPAWQALRESGLEPVSLAPKEGLALVNGTSFMSGYAVLAAHDAEQLAYAAEVCTALASQVLLGNPGHFAGFLAEQKPHPGVITSAETVRNMLVDEAEYLAGQSEAAPDVDFRVLERPIQDRYSVRCCPHVAGVLRDTVDWVNKWLAVEVNSSNDNPLFDVQHSVVRNGGNFYGGHVGQAMDSLKTAVASVADMLDRQLELVVDEKFNNGLTPNLVPRTEAEDYEAGLCHGFKGMQLTASALTAEALKLTNPATSFSRSTEAHNQDKVSMGTIAARDARSVVELAQQVTAIHLIALCQAVDLRGTEVLTNATRAVYERVRGVSDFLEWDRPLDSDIEAVTSLITSGQLRTAAFEGGA